MYALIPTQKEAQKSVISIYMLPTPDIKTRVATVTECSWGYSSVVRQKAVFFCRTRDTIGECSHMLSVYCARINSFHPEARLSQQLSRRALGAEESC